MKMASDHFIRENGCLHKKWLQFAVSLVKSEFSPIFDLRSENAVLAGDCELRVYDFLNFYPNRIYR
jgi:hypothetical protein